MRSVCRDEDMPGKTTVLRWLDENEEFRDQYARAREAQADHYADEIIEIADDATNDFMERKRKDGSLETVLDGENIQRSRLRVDARKCVNILTFAESNKLRRASGGGDDGSTA